MTSNDDSRRHVSDTIENRVGVGHDPMVAGWQKYLTTVLENMQPYLVAGRLVTFQTLSQSEKMFYRQLTERIVIPDSVVATYLPPSVRYQMMYSNHGSNARYESHHHPDRPPDSGVVLASAQDRFPIIVNALFAHPPCLAAVDIYDQGSLIAGYTYASIDLCQKSLGELIQTYLVSRNKEGGGKV